MISTIQKQFILNPNAGSLRANPHRCELHRSTSGARRQNANIAVPDKVERSAAIARCGEATQPSACRVANPNKSNLKDLGRGPKT